MIVARSTHRDPPQAWNLVSVAQKNWLLLSTMILGGLGVALAVWVFTPNRYVAEAVVALDARKVQVLTIDSVVSRLPQDSPVLRTELDLIASRSMAQKVVTRLRLAAPEHAEEGSGGVSAWLRKLLKPSAPVERSPDAALVTQLVSGLRVSNDGRSYTIFITYEAKDPTFARDVANAYAEAYLDHQVSLQAEATLSASGWLGRKVSELGARLEVSETAVEEFRRKSNLVETKGETADGQRLAGANIELAAARSQRAGAEARLAAATELKRNDSVGASFSEVLASAPIQALRLREAEIGRGIGDIEASGAAMSADLPAQRVQLAAVRRQIDGEVERVIASLANEVDVARRKDKSIEQVVKKFEADVARNSEARVELNRLEREAAANRAIYESFLNRYKQTIEQQGLATPDAKLLSSAELPMSPASPKLLPLLAFGAFAGALAGAGVASLKRRTGSLEHEPSGADETARPSRGEKAAGSERPLQQRQA